MRVVHFVKAFSPLSQTFIYDYVTEMQRQGVDTSVLTFRRENEADRPFAPVEVLPPPSRYRAVRLLHRVRGMAREPSDPSLAERRISIKAALERLDPTIVHAHFGLYGVQAEPVTTKLGIPLVVTFYGFDASRMLDDPEWVRRYQRFWPRVDRVTVLSESMRARLMDRGCPSAKISIIRLGKDLSQYEYLPSSSPVRRFVSVGRLVEKKGHSDLLRSMRSLKSAGSDVHLTIVGDGPLRSRLEMEIEALDLGDRVTLAGAAPHSEVIELMRNTDAFVLASKTGPDGDQEGTPTVLIEAQAMGLPCVSTLHAGIPEQIPTESHWLLAPEGDSEAIADRIDKLSRCSAAEIEKIRRAGRRKVEREFDLITQVEELRALYATLR